MVGIFNDEGRGTGPIGPNSQGAGTIFPPAASRPACGEGAPRRRPLLTGSKVASRPDRNVFVNRPQFGRAHST